MFSISTPSELTRIDRGENVPLQQVFAPVEYTCLNVLLLRHRFDIVMALIGYWRCSSDAQDEERQVASLKQAGCLKIYGDKIKGPQHPNLRILHNDYVLYQEEDHQKLIFSDLDECY